jgi:hypothetical protein
VYESAYLVDLNQRVSGENEASPKLQEIKEKFTEVNEEKGMPSSLKPEVNKNMVQSVKSLREHRFGLPGRRAGEETGLDRSADLANNQFGGEGAYVDSICNELELNKLTKLLSEAKSSTLRGIHKPSIRSRVLTKLKGVEDLINTPSVDKGSLTVGKKSDVSSISKSNEIEGKRKRQ